MAHHNKFDYRIKQNEEKWDAEITRRVTAHKTTVSKRKKGFESEALAEEWAKAELAGFLENLKEHNKRKAEKRSARDEHEAKVKAEKEESARLYEERRLAAQEAEENEEDDIEA